MNALAIVLLLLSAPGIRNKMLVPHAQDESAFPATAANTQGAILFGTDAGYLYMSPGDGGPWNKFGILLPVSIANGGTNGTTTPTNGAVAYGTGTGYAFNDGGAAYNGLCLKSAGVSPPQWGACNAAAYPVTASTPLTAYDDGGVINITTEALTAASPLHVYDDGGVINFTVDPQQITFTAVEFETTSPEDTNYTGGVSFASLGATTASLTCAWHSAPTGDNTQELVMQFWDLHTNTEFCSCNILHGCNPADTGEGSGGSVDIARSCACTGGALAASRALTVRMKSSTTCSSDPGQLVCNGVLTIP